MAKLNVDITIITSGSHVVKSRQMETNGIKVHIVPPVFNREAPAGDVGEGACETPY